MWECLTRSMQRALRNVDPQTVETASTAALGLVGADGSVRDTDAGLTRSCPRAAGARPIVPRLYGVGTAPRSC